MYLLRTTRANVLEQTHLPRRDHKNNQTVSDSFLKINQSFNVLILFNISLIIGALFLYMLNVVLNIPQIVVQTFLIARCKCWHL